MAGAPAMAVRDAVYKLQLSLLDCARSEEQLFAAGGLLARADYEDVVTERSIAGLCGYPPCRRPLPPDDDRRGRYRISLKEHRVYDLQETRKFCSSECLVNSRAFAASLAEERRSELDWGNVEEVLLRVFGDLGLGKEGKTTGELQRPELKIVEKIDVRGGEVALDDWVGPSNAIEGYVPLREHGSTRGRGIDVGLEPPRTEIKKEKSEDNVGFTSSIIFGDQKEFLNGGKDAEVNFTSSILFLDESSASKKLSGSGKVGCKSGEKLAAENSSGKHGSGGKSEKKPTGKTSSNQIRKAVDSDRRKLKTSDDTLGAKEATSSNEAMQKSTSGLSGAMASLNLTNQVTELNRIQTDCFLEPSETEKLSNSAEEHGKKVNSVQLKTSLKSSSRKKLGRCVTWADEKMVTNVDEAKLCNYHEIEGKSVRAGSLGGSKDDDTPLRLESAEACASALTQAAEAVASGELEAVDAVSDVGITIVPPGEDTNEANHVDSVDDIESDTVAGKWPKKTILLDTDAFDSEDSWHDTPPEGFTLNLSSFATMWMALFGWVSSSSLAYVYGQNDETRDDFAYINGREYPCKIVLSDGRSSEIKRTLEGCISRVLPEVVSCLRIRSPLSIIEKAMGSLVETMSLLDALPPFKTRQWQVIMVLFLDALSVHRLPSLSETMTNNRTLIHKIFDAAQVSGEEYETMKDLLLPLGRSPEFSSQSGA